MPRIIAIRGIFVFSNIKYALEAALTHKVRISSSAKKNAMKIYTHDSYAEVLL